MTMFQQLVEEKRNFAINYIPTEMLEHFGVPKVVIGHAEKFRKAKICARYEHGKFDGWQEVTSEYRHGDSFTRRNTLIFTYGEIMHDEYETEYEDDSDIDVSELL